MNEQTFIASLNKIKGAIKSGDVTRLAKKAGYSTQTLRNAFKRTNVTRMTDAEQHILQVCMEDDIIRQRIEKSNELETQALALTNINN